MKSKQLKVMTVFGTRPEAIKMAPVIKQLELNKDNFRTVVCVTAQHREMLDQVLNLFKLRPHHDLDLMTPDQTLSKMTRKILQGVTEVLQMELPDVILVQGDTTTTFVSALAAYYNKIPVAHIEAGLRTNDKYNPFPEEINRRLTTNLADFHFAPTKAAKVNLLREGIPEGRIHITGNTVIDALHWVTKKLSDPLDHTKWSNFFEKKHNILLSNSKKTILVTGHRRESFGKGFENISAALSILGNTRPDLQIVYPVHLNPNVRRPVLSILGNVENVHLISPLDYEPFVFLLMSSYLVLTDSGGIQEEAPSLGKPVLVMRDTTERPEGVEAGTARLVGTNTSRIVDETIKLLEDKKEYTNLSKRINPYGDGNASERIVSFLFKTLAMSHESI